MPDTKAAVIAALERTGGVITSAGLVLAATFGVLMALPLELLFQVGLVVALGLLADTFPVRALWCRRSRCCWASATGGRMYDPTCDRDADKSSLTG